MKKIVVCFKITDDYDALSINDWHRSDDMGRPETDFTRRILGCFDEAALENGLLLKSLLKDSGEESELIALTVNPGYSDHIIRRIAATGYDRIVVAETDENLDFYPESTAKILGKILEKMPDTYAVLTGARCAPGDTGVLPFFLAEYLGVKVCRDVTRFYMDSGYTMVEMETGSEYRSEPVYPGRIYVMNNTEKSFLRIPTLREKMKFRDFSVNPVKTNVTIMKPDICFHTAVSERQCVFLDEKGISSLIEDLKGGGKQ